MNDGVKLDESLGAFEVPPARESGGGMTGERKKSYFAPPERLAGDVLQVDIDVASNHPVLSGVLTNVGGLIAVLNEYRQIVSLNTSFLEMLGVEDVAEVLGLRPGEAVNCDYADDGPAGCGTGRYCTTCGAAIAIVSCLERGVEVVRRCSLTARRQGREVQIALQVSASPMKVNSRKYVLLFLQDITLQEQRAALERTFFHDVNNMLSMLVQASELLIEESPSTLSKAIHDASVRLVSEVGIQRCLFEEEGYRYQPKWREYDAGQILQELRIFFATHDAGKGKTLQFPDHYQRIPLTTDSSSLFRVLLNMIINALEATDKGGVVKVWVEWEGKAPVFCVWNSLVIPQEVALRIFQRSFSTKEQAGRGIGTYSMKLFGEKILGGKVTFTSVSDEGTTFRFAHPAAGRCYINMEDKA